MNTAVVRPGPRTSRARVQVVANSRLRSFPAMKMGRPRPRSGQGRLNPACAPGEISAGSYRAISARNGSGVLSRSPVAGRRWMARTTSIPSTTRPNAA